MSFERIETLGRGTFATVHLARDPGTGGLVALKVLSAPQEEEGPSLLLAAEAEVLSSLPPGLGPALFEWGENFLVLEYVEGRDLARLSPAPPDLAADLAVALAEALATLHGAGFVHGDLTPAHAVLTPGGAVRLLDFTFAHRVGAAPRVRGGAGTPAFASPEALAGAFGDPRSDLWSAGAILYELLTGSPPYVGPEPADALAPRALRAPEAPSRLRPGVPPVLDRLVLSLLRPDPDDRPHDAAAFAQAARAAAASDEVGRLRRADASAVLLSPQFQGREKEIEEVLALLLGDDLDALVAVVFRGAPGSGRTRLLEEFRAALAPFGLPVAPLLPPGDGAPAFETDARVLLLDTAGPPDAAQAAVAAARLETLRFEPAVLLCTAPWRGDIGDPVANWIPPRVRVLEKPLPPLTPDQIRRLARSALGHAPLDPALADAVARAARGNPGLAMALLQDLADRGVVVRTGVSWELRGPVPDPLPAGARAGALLARRAEGFKGPTRRLLEAAVFLPDGTRAEALRRAAGLGRAEGEAALAEAVRERILEPGPVVAFTHDAIRRALRERLGEDPGFAPPALAPPDPLPASPPPAPPPAPAPPAETEDLAEPAQRKTGRRVRSRIELLLVLARAYMNDGRIASAEETLGTALLEGQKYERADILAKAHFLLGKLSLERRDFRTALKNLNRAAAGGAEEEDGAVTREAAILKARALFESGDAAAAMGALLRARELAGRAGDREASGLLKSLEGEITASKGDPGRALLALGRALREARGGSAVLRSWAQRAVGRAFRLAGDAVRARRHLASAARAFHKAEEGLSVLAAHLQAGLASLFARDRSGMEESLRAALKVFGSVPPGGLRRLAETLKAGAALERGEPEVADEALAEGERAGGRPEDDPAGWAFLRAVSAAAAFARRDALAAVQLGKASLDLLDREAFVLEQALVARYLSSSAPERVAADPETAADLSKWAAQAAALFDRAGLAGESGRARVRERELREGQGPAAPRRETADAVAAPPPAAAGDRSTLFTLARISKTIASELDRDRLLALIMDMAIETVQAERGFLLLAGESGALEVELARRFGGADVTAPEFEVSRSIAEEVVRSGEGVLTADAGADGRFSERVSVMGLRLRSVLCVPLRSRGRVLGAVYVEDRRGAGAFGAGDMDFLSAFADQAAVALENARLLGDLKAKTRQLEASKREVEALNRELKREVDRQASELSDLERRMEAERVRARLRYDYGNIVGESDAMRRVFELLDRVTPSDAPVLVVGESGTGKELVARALHANGPRADKAFAVENVAAIPETLLESELFGHVRGAFTGADRDRAGLFEVAQGGTLFLDEVGEMSPGMQAKLLRVLQDGSYRPVGGKELRRADARLVYASNRDLRKLVEDGRFREDLFYRMNVLTVRMPPLRERVEDIPLLVAHFLKGEGGTPLREVDREALRLLLARPWPGNVRELENEIRRAVALSDGVIRAEHLSVPGAAAPGAAPAASEPPGTLKDRVEALEARLIREALARCEGNRTRAAEELGLSRQGLLKKMGRYGLA